MLLNKKISFLAGAVCGLIFAPVFFTPAILMLSVLCRQIINATTGKQAVIFSYLFGLGFFLTTLYWISFGVSVYIDQFWWLIPLALLGLPAFIACFVAIVGLVAWRAKKSKYYHFIFCLVWLFIEWLTSWIFTGLPWGLVGYASAVSLTLSQIGSITGIFGLSFIMVYLGSAFYSLKGLKVRIVTIIMIISAVICYGYLRLNNNLTKYSEVSVRLVQPSIPQIAKWDPEIFWQNLDTHIKLSQKPGNPDIIIWSEAALTAPYYYPSILNEIKSIFSKNNQILISGGINDNRKQDEELEIYSAMIALKQDGELLFQYDKSHLVPFGEYVPLKNILPIKKITSGLMDYSPGQRKTVYLKPFDLMIQPLICYESVFPYEVKINNNKADLMINVTNDAWYGNSSGPYQHFEISKMRAIENGLPMLRVGNNGISAIIDPVGRVIKKLDLNQIDIIDGLMPRKLESPTVFSKYCQVAMLLLIIIIFILQSANNYFLGNR